MRHGSLFSGIGGFDLAAEWMNWENVFHCEWNDFGQKILKHYWPRAQTFYDIKKSDFTIYRGKIDVLTGGFPCQPYSSAGLRKGKEDERHLWPEMLRAIREIRPRWIVGENVLGLVNWSGGMVFDEVQADLENEGYEVTPYILPAAGVGAPHQRYRVFFVAYANNNTNKSPGESSEIKRGGGQNNDVESERRETSELNSRLCDVYRVNSDSNNSRLQGGAFDRNPKKERENGEEQFTGILCPEWGEFPTEPPIRNGIDGISEGLDGITLSEWINETIKGGGNAIVPQVVLRIFKAIEQYEKLYV